MKNNAIMTARTEHSLKNASMSVKEYVKNAKNIGYEYLALTDLDSMTGIIEFILECKNNNIKSMPGIEAVFDEDLHSLILLAKNYKGYQQINKAFREANKNIHTDQSSKISIENNGYLILDS